MVYKFRMLSGEVKDFIRDIEILPEQSFYDFHRAIVHDLHYDKSQIASFFLTSSGWEKLQEFTLFDISDGEVRSPLPMDKAIIKDYFFETRQRMIYVYDFFNERAFFIELMEIIKGMEKTGYPRVIYSVGRPPAQLLFDTGSTEEDGIE